MLAEIYQLHRQELVVYATRRVNAAVAEELVQDAFLTLAATTNVVRPRAFLYRCLINNMRNHVSTEGRRRGLLENFPIREEVAIDPVEQSECVDLICRLLRQLPQGEVACAVFRGESVPDTATRFGKTVMSVRQTIKRARAHVRKHLTNAKFGYEVR